MRVLESKGQVCDMVRVSGGLGLRRGAGIARGVEGLIGTLA